MPKTNCNFSVGIDIEDIRRFKKANLSGHASLLSKIFTVKEIEYCLSKNNPAPYFTARFAGKEAVLKALAGVRKSKISVLDYKKIEISNGKNNEPMVKINSRALKGCAIKISLSHCGDKAVAVAILINF